ncbi:MAG: 1-acyl-sn-glycerol-3-phosphate acyltransferase [Desulfobacteraceae bacterium]|nr:1-acyl-sn-glycerol-3-phosphate acyltransferase [Desulfobacteraceae bacterium]
MDAILKTVYQPYKWLFVIPFMVLSTLFHGMVCIIVVLFFGADAGNIVAVTWARIACIVAPIRVKIRGRHNYTRKKTYVVVANHQSMVDIPVVQGWLGLRIKWVMKKELKKVPVFGPACRSLGCIYIDRSDREAAIRSIAEAKARLTRKSAVLFFPEGTRSRDGKMLPFKKGAFRFAMDAGLPILPITIKNSREILPPDSLDLTPGEVEIIIHPEVRMTGIDIGGKSLDETIARVRETICQAL